MNLICIGLLIVVIGIGAVKHSSILGALLLIVGASIMMKGKRDLDPK